VIVVAVWMVAGLMFGLASKSKSLIHFCRGCDAAIRDPGPYRGPENDAEGHARDCSRLAAAVDEREAQWEAEA